MNARERVIAALDHRRPDRLPRYDTFFPSFTKQWRAARHVFQEADIRAAYRIDIPFVLANQEGPFWRESHTDDQWYIANGAFAAKAPLCQKNHAAGQGDPDYLVRDSWGRLRRQRRDNAFYEIIETAIREKQDIDKLSWSGLRDSTQRILTPEFMSCLNDTRFAPVTGVMGLFMAGTYLRGETEFMMDLLEDELFCLALVEKMRCYLTELGNLMLEATNTWDTGIWVYDDFSVKAGPLISPAIFEKLFLPAYRIMFSDWKAKGARHIILHHDVMNEHSYPIIDMFADAGLDGVQGVYPTSEFGLTATKFKQRYGRRLSVIGGMDNTHTLPFGSRHDIEREALMVAEVAKEGGVIIGSHSIEGYIPVQHYDWYHSILEKIDEQWQP